MEIKKYVANAISGILALLSGNKDFIMKVLFENSLILENAVHHR